MSGVLFTIGYEKASLGDVLLTLSREGTRTLIDARGAPVSRKPGFSKNMLKAAVEEAGMAYVHLGAIGTPADGRKAAKAGRMEEFLEIYQAQLATPEAQSALGAATLIAAGDGPACLLCFEREPDRCHRSIVADLIAADTGLEVRHLFVAPTLL